MILIIGKTGQLARALLGSAPVGVDVVALGRDDLDVGDLPAVGAEITQHAPSLVINATAYTAVDRAEQDEAAAHLINAAAPAHMARAARDAGARFVHVSTDFVFDGTGSVPYAVDAPRAPLGVYGATKAEGELAVLAADPDALIVRTAWVYDATGKNFVTTMLRLMAERPELGVVSDQVGTPTSAGTLATALWELIEAKASGIHHFTDAGVASWYDFAVAISELALEKGLLASSARVRPIRTVDYPTPARRPAYSVLDKTATWPLLSTSGQHWRAVLAAVLADVPK